MQEPKHRYTIGCINASANSFIFRGSELLTLEGNKLSVARRNIEAALQVFRCEDSSG